MTTGTSQTFVSMADLVRRETERQTLLAKLKQEGFRLATLVERTTEGVMIPKSALVPNASEYMIIDTVRLDNLVIEPETQYAIYVKAK